MPYNMPYQPNSNEVTNKELITHIPSHTLIDNNQIMPNPHHYTSQQDTNLVQPPNSLAVNSNHLNTVVDSDSYYSTLSNIGAYNEQTNVAKKRKRDVPNDDQMSWYEQDSQQQQDVKLIQQQYDSTNNLYVPSDHLIQQQSNNQLQQPQQKAIFNNNYNYIDPNEQWSNSAAANANAHQQTIPNNYHYEQTTNPQNIGQLGNLGHQSIPTTGYMPTDTSMYDGGLPPMSQLRASNNVQQTNPNYLTAPDQQANFQQGMDNASSLHISQQQQGVIMEERDIDDALNILKTHAEIPNFNQQLTQLDHVQSPTNDVSASMLSLSTNTVSTTSNLVHDDKVGSSNAFLRQKMNSSNNLSLGKGSKRSRSSRK